MEAYDRYLEARGLIAQRRDFERTIKLLTEANQMDPDFAEGWAANAQAHSLSIYYMDVDRDETKNKAEAQSIKRLTSQKAGLYTYVDEESTRSAIFSRLAPDTGPLEPPKIHSAVIEERINEFIAKVQPNLQPTHKKHRC